MKASKLFLLLLAVLLAAFIGISCGGYDDSEEDNPGDNPGNGGTLPTLWTGTASDWVGKEGWQNPGNIAAISVTQDGGKNVMAVNWKNTFIQAPSNSDPNDKFTVSMFECEIPSGKFAFEQFDGFCFDVKNLPTGIEEIEVVFDEQNPTYQPWIKKWDRKTAVTEWTTVELSFDSFAKPKWAWGDGRGPNPKGTDVVNFLVTTTGDRYISIRIGTTGTTPDTTTLFRHIGFYKGSGSRAVFYAR